MLVSLKKHLFLSNSVGILLETLTLNEIMAKTSFYIDKPKEKKSVIMMNISLNGFRLQVSTGISIPTRVWLKSKQAIKPSFALALEYNAILKHLERSIVSFCTEAKLKGKILTKEDVKIKFRDIKNPTKKIVSDQILKSFTNYIELRKNDSKANTIEQYEFVAARMLEYEKANNMSLCFSTLNSTIWDGFENYLYRKGLKTTSVDLINKSIIAFLNFCVKRDMLSERKVKYLKEFICRISEKSNVNVALNEEELKAIFEYKPQRLRFEKTKDLFLIQCHTGLRYSDLFNLKPENINLKELVVTVSAIKTGDNITIPINEKIADIFKKWDCRLPYFTTVQYNKNLKLMCKEIGFDTPIQKVFYRGKERIEETKPKYELISSHTARRTMVTLALKKGMLPEMLMKISGHTSRRSFESYVKITEEEARKQFRNLF